MLIRTIFAYMAHHAGVSSKACGRPTPRGRRARKLPTRGAKAPDALSAALASGAFATLVRYFTVRPEAAPHMRALIRETRLNSRSVQMEVARMETLGLVRREHATEDRRVSVRAVLGHPAWTALRTLVRTYAAPEDVLKMTVAGVPGIAAAFVYGSVARGDATPESDCDFMVVTAPGLSPDAHRDVEQALAVQTGSTSLALGRDLSVAVYSATSMQHKAASGHGFVARVLADKKRWVRGSDAEFAKLLRPLHTTRVDA